MAQIQGYASMDIPFKSTQHSINHSVTCLYCREDINTSDMSTSIYSTDRPLVVTTTATKPIAMETGWLVHVDLVHLVLSSTYSHNKEVPPLLVS